MEAAAADWAGRQAVWQQAGRQASKQAGSGGRQAGRQGVGGQAGGQQQLLRWPGMRRWEAVGQTRGGRAGGWAAAVAPRAGHAGGLAGSSSRLDAAGQAAQHGGRRWRGEWVGQALERRMGGARGGEGEGGGGEAWAGRRAHREAVGRVQAGTGVVGGHGQALGEAAAAN